MYINVVQVWATVYFWRPEQESKYIPESSLSYFIENGSFSEPKLGLAIPMNPLAFVVHRTGAMCSGHHTRLFFPTPVFLRGWWDPSLSPHA